MTVFDNIAFGLKARPPAGARRRRRSSSGSRSCSIWSSSPGLDKRYPAQLSGGQRQRVALARALAIEPRILLLDEPFGALDAKVRKELRRWLRDIHDRTGHTTVFVTHDQEEALELADRVVVMNQGKIEQVGTPDEVYDRPATPFVFGFIGETNALPVTVEVGDDVPRRPADRLGAAGRERRRAHVRLPPARRRVPRRRGAGHLRRGRLRAPRTARPGGWRSRSARAATASRST